MPIAALTIIFLVSLIPFDQSAKVVTIVGLWLFCGALYLRSAGLRAPAIPGRRILALATVSRATG